MEGQVYKMGESLGQWIEKYMVLEEGRLIQFANKRDKVPRRIVVLQECRLKDSPKRINGKYTFQLQVLYLSRTFTLGFDSVEDKHRWKKEILSGISESSQFPLVRSSLNHATPNSLLSGYKLSTATNFYVLFPFTYLISLFYFPLSVNISSTLCIVSYILMWVYAHSTPMLSATRNPSKTMLMESKTGHCISKDVINIISNQKRCSMLLNRAKDLFFNALDTPEQLSTFKAVYTLDLSVSEASSFLFNLQKSSFDDFCEHSEIIDTFSNTLRVSRFKYYQISKLSLHQFTCLNSLEWLEENRMLFLETETKESREQGHDIVLEVSGMLMEKVNANRTQVTHLIHLGIDGACKTSDILSLKEEFSSCISKIKELCRFEYKSLDQKIFPHYNGSFKENVKEAVLDTNWIQRGSLHGIMAFSKPTVDGYIFIKMQAKIKGSFQNILKLLQSNPQTFDSRIVDFNVLENHSQSNTTHVVFCASSNSLLSPRDLCVLCSLDLDLSGSRISACISMSSVDHKDCPPEAEVVRCHLKFGGYYLVELDEQTCLLTFIENVDLRMPKQFSLSEFLEGRHESMLRIRSIVESDEWRLESPISIEDSSSSNISLILQAADHGAKWVKISSQENLKVYQRSWNGLPIELIRSVSIISAPAGDVASVLTRISYRHWYDPVFDTEKSKVLQILDERTHISHVHFSASKLCTGASRDFVVYRHWKTLEDGSIVIFMKSVEHVDAPVTDVSMRGHIHIAGYVIQRFDGRQVGKPKESCKVTFLSQVDLNSGSAQWIKNIWQRLQPNTLQRLDRLFTR